jgi:hypothetical protein
LASLVERHKETSYGKLAEPQEFDISEDHQKLTTNGIEVDCVKRLIRPLMLSPRVISSEFASLLYPAVWIGYAFIILQRIWAWKFDHETNYDKLKEYFHSTTLRQIVLSKLHNINELLNQTRLKIDPNLPEKLWKTLLVTTSSDDRFQRNEETHQKEYEELIGISPNSTVLQQAKAQGILFANIALTLYRRSFFAGARYYGIAENKIREGDKLVLLFPPIYCPFIIRPKDDSTTYQFISVAYIPPKDREDALKMPKKAFTIV